MAVDLTTAAGREDANRRVAEAMDPPWQHHPPTRKERSVFTCTKDIACWRRGAHGDWQMAPPAYLTDDPALNREMWKALPREVNTWWRHSEGPVSTGERWHWVQRGWDTGDIDTCGTTFAEALVLALDAAGLLEEANE